MANPTLKNGYTKIADNILEALSKVKLSGREFRILLVIIRKTYGWNKSGDYISLKELSKMTTLDKQNISKVLNKLKKKKIVVKKDNYFRLFLKFNKNYDKWLSNLTIVKNDNKRLSKMTTNVVKNDNPKSRKSATRATSQLPKNTIQKTIKESEDLLPCRHNGNQNRKNTHKFLDFIFITKKEYDNLIYDYGKKAVDNTIENMNNFIGMNGDKYKNHFYTLKAWLKKDYEKIERRGYSGITGELLPESL